MATAVPVVPADLPLTTREHPLIRNLAWVLVAVGHLLVFPYYARVNNPNENVRVWTTKALVDHGTFAVEAVEQQWGFVDDKVVVGSHLYSAKAPALSLLGVPVYFVQSRAARLLGKPPPSKMAVTLALRLFAVGLPLGLFFWILSRYLERVTASRAGRDLLVVALGLGSLFYPYGVIFVGHTHGAALAFVAFMLLAPPGGAPASRRSRFAAGLAAGAAVLFEYQVVVVAAVLAAYALARYRRGVGWFLLGALPPAAALALYHGLVFGKPWELPWAHVQNAGFAAYHAQGFLGLTAPRADAVGAMLFAPELGLFVFSPYLLVGVAGAVFAAVVSRAHRARVLTVLAASVAMLLFISSMSFWRGGWCAGPRYITVLAPFLTYGVALVWGRLRRSPGAWVLLGALVIFSVFMNVLSGALYPHYPTQFDNPVFDVAVPLLRHGFAPYSAGRLMHLPGVWSLAPLGLVVVAALVLALRSDGPRRARRGRVAAGTVVLAGALLFAFSRYGSGPSTTEAALMNWIEVNWEPAQGPAQAPAQPAVAPR